MAWKYLKHIMSKFHVNLSPFMFFLQPAYNLICQSSRFPSTHFHFCELCNLWKLFSPLLRTFFHTLSLLWIIQFVHSTFSIRVQSFCPHTFTFMNWTKFIELFTHQSSRIPSTHFYLRMQGLGCLGTSSSWVQRTRQGDLYQLEFRERGLLSYLQLPLGFDSIIKSRNKVAQCQGSSAWMGIVFIPPHVNSIYSFSDLPSWGPWDWPWQER